MSDISQWDPVDANNSDPPPDGWPEGQSAGSLNDCGRAVMGAVRRQWEQAAWFDYGEAVTFVSTTELNLVGTDLANRYHVGRRVRVIGTATGTVYGRISNTAGDYVITVELDSGAFSADPDLEIAVGAPADNSAISYDALANIPPATDTPYPPAHLAGLGLTNGADADHEISIAAGSARDVADGVNMSLSGALTKDIEPITGWAEGNNQPGFPNALSLAADTWYRVFVIAKPDGTTDGGFDVSPVAVNLLSDAAGDGYTTYRQVGWIRTDSASNIRAFTQTGDLFLYNDPSSLTLDYNAAPTPDTDTTITIGNAPAGLIAKLNVYGSNAGSEGFQAILHASIQASVPLSATSAPLSNFGQFSNALNSPFNGSMYKDMDLLLDSSQQIHARVSTATTLRIVAIGWYDTRGK